MAKIAPDGTVTYEPGHEPGSGEEHVHPAAPGMAVEHPTDGTMSPPASNPPVPGEPEGEQVANVPVPEAESAELTPPAPASAPDKPAPKSPPRRPPSKAAD